MKTTITKLGNNRERETTRYSDGHGKSVTYERGLIFRKGKINSVSKW